jgi:hypothetical protein
MRAAPALLAALLAASPALAERVDLTGYLTVYPVVGDYKLYAASSGEVRREEIVRVETYPTGWSELVEYQLDGVPVGGSLGVVIPGRRTVLAAFAAGGLVLVFPPPGAKLPLRLAPGQRRRSVARGRAEVEGRRVGSARIEVERTFAGFEAKQTPAASYPDTARIESASSLRVKDAASGRVIEVRERATAWHAPGIGQVASEVRTLTYVDGVLMEDSGPVSAHFTSGQVGGFPYP